MAAEGFGPQTAADPHCESLETAEKQPVGTVTASHKKLTLQALQVLSMPALQREAAWADERLVGDLWQSVPQNGRVHLHIRDYHSKGALQGEGYRILFGCLGGIVL